MGRFFARYEKVFWILALGAVVFFGRWRLLGLTPDAALYAGLSYKVLQTGEPWLISGTANRFPIYFEHPPYFFQWGALVFSWFGVSEGVARAIGAIPGYLGFAVMCIWVSRRWNQRTALLTGLLALVWGHYTKFAATSMLEAPLSLAVAMAVMATFELHWRKSLGLRRVGWWAVLFTALFLATAAKGVAGLGVLGGLGLSILLAMCFSERAPLKVLMGALSIGLCVLIALLPFVLWLYQLVEKNDVERFVRYLSDQVMRSMLSNRGEIEHPISGDRLYYWKLFLRDGLIGFVCFVGGAGYFVYRFFSRKNTDSKKTVRKNVGYVFNAFSYILSFTIPFSLVTFQLPHYIHPIYLPMLIPGAAAASELLEKRKLSAWLGSRNIRWGLLFLIAAAFPVLYSGVSKTPNRGQNFIAASEALEKLHPLCEVLIARSSIDAYSAEAFAMWYFRNRPWTFSRIGQLVTDDVPSGKVFWDPLTHDLIGGLGCQ